MQKNEFLKLKHLLELPNSRIPEKWELTDLKTKRFNLSSDWYNPKTKELVSLEFYYYNNLQEVMNRCFLQVSYYGKQNEKIVKRYLEINPEEFKDYNDL